LPFFLKKVKCVEDFEYDVGGAPVVFTTLKPKPHNPLNRPPISYKKPVISLIVYFLGLAVIIILSVIFSIGLGWLICLGWSLLLFSILGKKTAIWFVHLYQNKASDKTRLKCVFEPSCSEYMIMAINKYGLIRGVFKGIRRLLRCHPPNGGEDYP